ncbi:hypothetical protein PG984_012086 [Apiospora sp. TS-2023a]
MRSHGPTSSRPRAAFTSALTSALSSSIPFTSKARPISRRDAPDGHVADPAHHEAGEAVHQPGGLHLEAQDPSQLLAIPVPRRPVLHHLVAGRDRAEEEDRAGRRAGLPIEHIVRSAFCAGRPGHIISAELSQGVQKNLRRCIETARARDTTVGPRLPEIILNDSTVLPGRLADDDVAEPDIDLVVETRDAAADADEDAEAQRRKALLHLTGDRGGRVGAHLAGGQTGSHHVMNADAAEGVEVRIGREGGEGGEFLVHHLGGGGQLDGQGADPAHGETAGGNGFGHGAAGSAATCEASARGWASASTDPVYRSQRWVGGRQD